MTYSRERHIKLADETKAGCGRASEAMRLAAAATFLLNVPVWLVAVDWAPKGSLLVATCLWALPIARALVRAGAAHALLRRLERMNREAP